MIIDVHSHSPQYRGQVPPERRKINPAWRPDRAVSSVYNWEEYLGEQAPADITIVFGVAWHPGEGTGGVNGVDEASDMPGNVNDKTAAFAKAYPERLIGFMSLHPQDPRALEELERSRGDLSLRGIKLGANYQIFHPLEARALAIYERAQKYGLPILFHQGTSPVRMAPIRYAHPLLMDEVAMRYPDLKIIVSHGGGTLSALVGRLDAAWESDGIGRSRLPEPPARSIARLYVDAITYAAGPFHASIAMVGSDRVMFGTDHPFSIEDAGATMDAMETVDDTTRHSIFAGNASALFALT